ncbi:hypothetical protein GCM10020001_101420 [Nonomuraea salmonea]
MAVASDLLASAALLCAALFTAAGAGTACAGAGSACRLTAAVEAEVEAEAEPAMTNTCEDAATVRATPAAAMAASLE